MMEIVPRLESARITIATFANVIIAGRPPLLGNHHRLIKAFTAVAQVNPARRLNSCPPVSRSR